MKNISLDMWSSPLASFLNNAAPLRHKYLFANCERQINLIGLFPGRCMKYE